jgi:hypothetical protein
MLKKLQKQLKEANHQLKAYKGHGSEEVGAEKDMERLIKDDVSYGAHQIYHPHHPRGDYGET